MLSLWPPSRTVAEQVEPGGILLYMLRAPVMSHCRVRLA